MRPNTQDTVQVQSSFDGEQSEFTIDQNSLAHIMSVLSGLYSDPELAVVREYVTNAYDSHIEAGQTRPIEITTPSHFSKAYVVRDFGIGMSVDDLRNIYSRYGASTKRHTDTQVGMLGLGSKCALTYTNSFTVTAVKGGVKTKAVISINEAGTPVFTIMDTRATTEPNGVEISIPVKDRNSFTDKTVNFLKWWPAGTVLVDGKEPTKHGLKEIKPGIFLNTRGGNYYESAKSYVVMGNVPYRIDDAYVSQDLKSAGMGIVAYVNIGDVAITPSRESLNYTPATKQKVLSLSQGLWNEIVKVKKDEIVNAPDHPTAFTLYEQLEYHFKRSSTFTNLTYKGSAFSERPVNPFYRLHWDYNGRGLISEGTYSQPSDMIRHKSMIVTGFNMNNKPTAFMKKKAKYYAETNGHNPDQIYFVDTDFDSRWLDHLPRVTADVIKNIKLPKQPRQPGTAAPKVAVPYDVYRWDGTRVVFSQEVTLSDKNIAYISPSDMRETYRKRGTTPEQMVKLIERTDLAVVVTGTNRFDKFRKAHPHAKGLRTFVQERINEWANAAPAEEFTYNELEYSEQRFVDVVKPEEIDDPELVALIKSVRNKGQGGLYKKAEALQSQAYRATMSVSIPDPKTPTPRTKIYPLIAHAGHNDIKHTVFYINSYYNQFVKEAK